MLTISDRIQLPSKTTHKDTGTKVHTCYFNDNHYNFLNFDWCINFFIFHYLFCRVVIGQLVAVSPVSRVPLCPQCPLVCPVSPCVPCVLLGSLCPLVSPVSSVSPCVPLCPLCLLRALVSCVSPCVLSLRAARSIFIHRQYFIWAVVHYYIVHIFVWCSIIV